MSNDDDMLEQFDLSAWDAPPPPADLADAVIERMGGTAVGVTAVPVETQRAPRRGWIVAAAIAAAVVLAIGVWSLLRGTHQAAPATGGVVADQARSLSLDTVHADLDAGADVRWRRDGDVLHVEQRAGSVTWHVDRDEKLVIDAGAASASVEATGANLRVEVQMNAMDARVIGASALTAAAVAMVTVVVYEGHVKVGTPNQQTVVVTPGTTFKANEKPDTAPTVGASVPRDGVALDQKVAILGLELVGSSDADSPIVTQVLSTSMRLTAAKEGPYELAPVTRELVDEKLLMNCATEAPPCMAAIGTNLGVDALVYGRLERSGKTYGVTVKLFDVASKQIKRSATQLIPVADAEGAKLDEYARKLYLEVVGTSTSTVCDAEALKDQGMEHINMGQHAAALAKFEESLKCKPDPYVWQLAFMESCSSGNSPKAKQYYKLLTPAQQTKFGQMCIRNKVDYQEDAAAVTDDCKGVDEVSCVLTNYEGDCCTKYKRPAKLAKLESLTRADIVAGIGKVKAKVMACDDQASHGGKLVARMAVKPDGRVRSVEITTSPDPRLTDCVTPILEGATFAARKDGGTFSYPFMFEARAASAGEPTPAPCDAKLLRDQGMENINLGQHAAALAKFEASLKCKKDPFTVQLAFMEACASQNSPKAKQYYKQMTPAQQQKFGQICIRNKVEFQ